MKKDITEFVYACLICQKSKIEHQKPSDLMQPLSRVNLVTDVGHALYNTLNP